MLRPHRLLLLLLARKTVLLHIRHIVDDLMLLLLLLLLMKLGKAESRAVGWWRLLLDGRHIADERLREDQRRDTCRKRSYSLTCL